MIDIGALRRVTLFAGHYGSGKTTLAVNFALWLRARGESVTIADMDIVNPYFRTRDSRETLQKAGIRLIASPFAGSNVDAPALPAEAYAAVEDTSRRAVMDVGGDDRGALALGRYAPFLVREGDYALWCVLNPCRPLTRTVADALSLMDEVESACRLGFTGVCGNANLGADTEESTVRRGLDFAREVARARGLPLVFTAAEAALCPRLADIPHLFPLTYQMKRY